MANYIFITGGLVSSLGKGVSASSLAYLLKARGYKVTLKKIEPYLNSDPSTISPSQHGEVFVTDDGAETDLDLGHYERFTNMNLKKANSTSCGAIYSQVLLREKSGFYKENTVKIVPHMTNAIKDFFSFDVSDMDFVICEIGGAVGDLDTIPILESVRQFTKEIEKTPMFIHLTLLPHVNISDEIKTRPTQYSIREFFRYGLSPDIILCRSSNPLSKEEIKEVAYYCNIKEKNIISASNLASIYFMPIIFYKQEIDKKVLDFFDLSYLEEPDLTKWKEFKTGFKNTEIETTIAIVGKYTQYTDAYKSVKEALVHSGAINKTKINIKWITPGEIKENTYDLADVSGVIIVGGDDNDKNTDFLNLSQQAREKNIPLFAIGGGADVVIEEVMQNIAGKKNIIDLFISERSHIGAFDLTINRGTLLHEIYKKDEISERYRSKTVVNPDYKNDLKKAGLEASGHCSDCLNFSAFELKNHPWFIAVRFHPEFKSRPFAPHPLFDSFIKTVIKKQQLI